MSTPAHTPPLPAGEVRLLPDGTRAICTGAPYWRWKLVNVHNDPDGGWRTDRDATGWERLGNVYELVVAATAVRDEPSSEDTPARVWQDRDGDRWVDGPDDRMILIEHGGEVADYPGTTARSEVESVYGPLVVVPAGGEPA